MDMLETRPTPPRRVRKTDPKDKTVRSKIYTQYTPSYVDPQFNPGSISSPSSCGTEDKIRSKEWRDDSSITLGKSPNFQGDQQVFKGRRKSYSSAFTESSPSILGKEVEQQYLLQEEVAGVEEISVEPVSVEKDIKGAEGSTQGVNDIKDEQHEQGPSYYVRYGTNLNYPNLSLGALSRRIKNINPVTILHDSKSDSSANLNLQQIISESVIRNYPVIFCLPDNNEGFSRYVVDAPKPRGILFIRHPVAKWDAPESSFILPYFQQLDNGEARLSAFRANVGSDESNSRFYCRVCTIDEFDKLIIAGNKITGEEKLSPFKEFYISMDQSDRSESHVYNIDEGFHSQLQEEQQNNHSQAQDPSQQLCTFSQSDTQLTFEHSANGLAYCDETPAENVEITSEVEVGTVQNVSVHFLLDPVGGGIILQRVEPEQLVLSEDGEVSYSSQNYMNIQGWNPLQLSESVKESVTDTLAFSSPSPIAKDTASSNGFNGDAVSIISPQQSAQIQVFSTEGGSLNSYTSKHVELDLHTAKQNTVSCFQSCGTIENSPVLIGNLNSSVIREELNIPSSINNNITSFPVRPETGGIYFLNKPVSLGNIPYSGSQEQVISREIILRQHLESSQKPTYVSSTLSSQCSESIFNANQIENGRNVIVSPANYTQVRVLPPVNSSHCNNTIINPINPNQNETSVLSGNNNFDGKVGNLVTPEGSDVIIKSLPARPRRIPGFVVLCRACGVTSSDLHNCERCKRQIPEDAKVQRDTYKTGEKNVPVLTAATTVGLGPNNASIPNPLSNLKRTPGGGKKYNTSSPAIKKGKGRKTEEVVVLSSDEDEDQPKAKIMKKDTNNFTGNSSGGSPDKLHPLGNEPLPPGITKHVQVSLVKLPCSPSSTQTYNSQEQPLRKRPQVMLMPGANLNCGSVDRDKCTMSTMSPTPEQVIEMLEDIDEISTTVGNNTYFNSSTIRVGDYGHSLQNSTSKITIAKCGIYFEMPHATEVGKMVKIGIPQHTVMSTIVHFKLRLPCIFLKTGPKFAVWIRNALGLNQNPDEGDYYCPINGMECQKYIAFLTITPASDLSPGILRNIFSSTLTEVDYVQVNIMVVQIKCAGHGSKEIPSTPPSEKLRIEEALTLTSGSGIQPVVITAAKPSPSKTTRSTTKKEKEEAAEDYAVDVNDNKKILSYQLITINQLDIMCLNHEQFLNDSILDFWMRYMHHEVLSPVDKARTYMFSTFFYKRLTTVPRKKSSLPEEVHLSRAEKRHARVKRWTKKVDIFDKDFIFVPINENCHWFLAVICYPGLIGAHEMETGAALPEYDEQKNEKLRAKLLERVVDTPQLQSNTPNLLNDSLPMDSQQSMPQSDLNTKPTPAQQSEKLSNGKTTRIAIKQPCILIFDSLAGDSRSRIFSTLREYLTVEYKIRKGQDREFNKNAMPAIMPVVPQQPNLCDCGIFVLFYVRCFFSHPIPTYEAVMKNAMVNDWFKVPWDGMREQIYNLLKDLAAKYNPESVKLIPKLNFPRPKKLKGKPPGETIEERLTLERVKPEDEPMDVDVDGSFEKDSQTGLKTEKLISSSSSPSNYEDSLHDVNRTSDHDHDYVSSPEKRVKRA